MIGKELVGTYLSSLFPLFGYLGGMFFTVSQNSLLRLDVICHSSNRLDSTRFIGSFPFPGSLLHFPLPRINSYINDLCLSLDLGFCLWGNPDPHPPKQTSKKFLVNSSIFWVECTHCNEFHRDWIVMLGWLLYLSVICGNRKQPSRWVNIIMKAENTLDGIQVRSSTVMIIFLPFLPIENL